MEHLSGYGSDTYTLSAKEKIRELCGCPEADVYFLAGGTQTNQTVIDSVLKSYEGVIAASTGHVSAHEAGAIEFTGHKVLTLPHGTQTNQTVIDSVLKSYEGVIAASTGHVSAHEAGAIEFTGHKVLTLPQKDGKITAEDLKDLIDTFYGDESHEHMVFPGMVYISHPTEYGTLYTKEELEAISTVCKSSHLAAIFRFIWTAHD